MSLLAHAGELEQGGAALNKYTPLLAKVHGWVEPADSRADASTVDYYTLVLVPGCVQSFSTMLASELFIRIPLQS